MKKPYTAMYCAVCKAKNEYYGRLVFSSELMPDADAFNAVAEAGGTLTIPDAPPSCPNHKKGVVIPLVPVVNTRSGVRSATGVVGP